MKKISEFERFDDSELLKVPHSEIKAKLTAEKQARKLKTKEKGKSRNLLIS
jgi:hypothetical protein